MSEQPGRYDELGTSCRGLPSMTILLIGVARL